MNLYTYLLIFSLLFTSCGDTSPTEFFEKQPKDTTKIIHAVNDDETDWTWFVGTDVEYKKPKLILDTYFMHGLPSEIGHLQYFLDTDNNPNTGFSTGQDSWKISGADFLIEDGDLYQSSSTHVWKWKYIGKFDSYTKNVKENITQLHIATNNQTISSMIKSNTINITIEPFDEKWGSSYSTISTQHVKIKGDFQDNTPPILDLKGEQNITLYIGDQYIDTVKAIDSRGENITNKIQTNSNLNSTKAGVYHITYNVSDSFGNNTNATRKIEVKSKHPFLFYSNNDREKMIARINKSPWNQFYKNLYGTSADAFKWWIDLNVTYAKKTRNTLVDNDIWREKSHGYLEPSSHRFANYIEAYDLLASWEGLSESDHRTIRNKIENEARYYYQTMINGVPGGANFGNQRVLASSALGLAALVLKDGKSIDESEYDEWLNRAIYEIFRDKNIWFFREGGEFVEGIGYSKYMSVQFIPFAISYQRLTGTSLLKKDRFKKWLEYASYNITNQGIQIPHATAEAYKGLGFMGLLSNTRYGGDNASLYHHIFNITPILHSYHNHIAIALYDDLEENKKINASKGFKKSPMTVMRKDWEKDTLSLWFFGKDSKWLLHERYWTYSHSDVGSFAITAFDELLSFDSGYNHWHDGGYVIDSKGNKHDSYTKHVDAKSHNVILIDDIGPDADTGGSLSNVSVDGDIKHATITASYQNCNIKRTLAYVRGKYIVDLDVVKSDTTHKYSWIFKSTSPYYNVIDNRSVSFQGMKYIDYNNLIDGKSNIKIVVPQNSTINITPSKWLPFNSKELDNQTLTADWTSKNSNKLFLLLPSKDKNSDIQWEDDGDGGYYIYTKKFRDHVTVIDDKIYIESY